MKIQVIQREFKRNKSYKICECKYCCEGIKKLPNIDFNYTYAENTNNPIVNDYGEREDLGVMLRHNVTVPDPWDNCDYTEEFFYKLNYCPICGEKIEVEIVDNVDITEEYERLSKERDEIHKKWIKTDSKKKERELSDKRQKLDQKINSLYWTDSLPEREENEED